jgi:ATP-dependent DNA helicase RecG
MNRKDLLERIANGENSGVEFKLDSIRPEQLAKEVVALANLKGGHILLGVTDDKSIVGITRDNLSEWVADTVFARYIHPLILPYYEEVLMDDGKIVAVITIGQEVSKPYVVRANDRETAYVRIGSVSRQATREQLLMLGSASGMVHSEIMPVHRTSFESLDLARLENYLRDILNDPEVPESRAAWITRLKALGLMVDGVADEPVCTIAGLLLFGIKPRQFLRQSGLRIMFFDAPDKIYQAQMDKVLDAPLVGRFQVGKAGKSLIDAGLIEKALELIEPFVTRESDHVDQNFRREKKWLYPFEALRELLINALAHRDWTRFVDVEIAGYQDRLEITSPGALPNSMTIEKVLAGQRSARNTIVVEVLRDYGYVDARGMGIRTKVVPLLEKFTGAAPAFEATDDYFKTTIRSANVPETVPKNANLSLKNADVATTVPDDTALKPLQGQIVALLKANPQMTYEELAAGVGQTRKTVQRHLQRLKAKGLLRRIGGAKGGYWEVTE